METSVKELGPCTIRSAYSLSCGDCGVTCLPAALRNVIKVNADGSEKKMLMCIDCIDDYDPRRYM